MVSAQGTDPLPQLLKSWGTGSKDTAGHRVVSKDGQPGQVRDRSSPLSRGLALLHTLSLLCPCPRTHCPGLTAQAALGQTSPGLDSAVLSHHSQRPVSKERLVGSVHWLLCCPYWPVTTPRQLGKAMQLPWGHLWGGCRRGEVGLFPVHLPPVRCHGHPPRCMFTPLLPWQGYQDHRLLALQLALELVPVLLGIGLSGHWLHPLGVRWRGEQVSQPSSRAILPTQGLPYTAPSPHAPQASSIPRNRHRDQVEGPNLPSSLS